MGRLERRLEDLEGAVLPERMEVIHVTDTDPATAGDRYNPDQYTVRKPEVMAGQTFTKAELDRFFPDALVIEVVIRHDQVLNWDSAD